MWVFSPVRNADGRNVEMKRSPVLLAWLFGLVILGTVASTHAEVVRPKNAVVTGVNIRAQSASNSPAVGIMRPGESLPYDGSVPYWHRVILADGGHGFVSKRWTEVIPESVGHTANFVVHFVDVGTGDAAIIDIGDREIVIDGGNSTLALSGYAERLGIIEPPIELVIVTHGDTDHWKGLRRLLGFDGIVDDPPTVLEFWDPGYNRDCNKTSEGDGRKNYLRFVEEMRKLVPEGGFRRPLDAHHTPAVVSRNPRPFTLDTIPGVSFTLLHSDSQPTAKDCSYRINNASIVLMVEVDGIRFLFTGDANGKEREEGSPPGHVEKKLLELAQNHDGLLRADVLKVPHHGSETASTPAFIKAVSPQYAIISASTIHHLPKTSVVSRYADGHNKRAVLRTDRNRKYNNDHILCLRLDGQLTCNFEDVLNE